MKAKDITLAALLLGLLIVFSQLSLPIGPIPITLQTLAVLLIGYLLEPKYTVIVGAAYILGGLVGLPIFSNFQGGFQSILFPSFGFILAFIPAAYLQAKFLERFERVKMPHLVAAGIINYFVTYLIGLVYMGLILNVYLGGNLTMAGILMAGLIPFIPGDILKLAISVVIAKRLIAIVNTKSAAV